MSTLWDSLCCPNILLLWSFHRDQMSHFVTGVSEDLQEECHSALLHDNMNISHLMVHARSVDKARAQRKSRDAKRARSYEGGFLKNSREIQDKPRFN